MFASLLFYEYVEKTGIWQSPKVSSALNSGRMPVKTTKDQSELYPSPGNHSQCYITNIRCPIPSDNRHSLTLPLLPPSPRQMLMGTPETAQGQPTLKGGRGALVRGPNEIWPVLYIVVLLNSWLYTRKTTDCSYATTKCDNKFWLHFVSLFCKCI